MNITKKLILELQNRLKIGNRRSVHLNAIPGRSRYKFDISRLTSLHQNLPQNFIDALLSEKTLKFKIGWKNNVKDLNLLTEKEQIQLVKITKSFENLVNQTEVIEAEKGINTFGFGFPLLVRRDRTDNKLTVAPILIWSLRIKRTKDFNTWQIQRDEDDAIYINEVLINHLQNDAKVSIEQIANDVLEDGWLNKADFLTVCQYLIEKINGKLPENAENVFKQKLQSVSSISEKKHYESLPLTFNNSFIDFCGLFSIFEVQKQNIIHDYTDLFSNLEGTSIDLSDMDKHFFQPISSIETDPSQQSILHALNTTRNILIQGPPGTGKSQSLLAILVNALENHKKTIVVCEKRTALEVLHQALQKKGLAEHCVLIKDIEKDRRTVVNSVRNRVDGSSYRRRKYDYSKENLEHIIEKASDLIRGINQKHQKLDEKIIGNNNWTDVVGDLLKALKNNSEDFQLNIKKHTFDYEAKELNHLLEVIRKAKKLYFDYKPYKDFSFLNHKQFVGNNPYAIEQEIQEDFEAYKTQFAHIKTLIAPFHKAYCEVREAEFETQTKKINALIEEIHDIYAQTPDIFQNISQQYTELRQKELQKQLDNIDVIVQNLKYLFEKYDNEPLFLDKTALNSKTFKLKSIFSSKLKTMKSESEQMEQMIQKLSFSLLNCKDISKKEFGDSLKDMKHHFYAFVEKLKTLGANFGQKIQKEFESFELNTLITDNLNEQKYFEILKNELENSNNNIENYNFLNASIHILKEHQQAIVYKFHKLNKLLEKAKDVENVNFSATLHGRKDDLNALATKITNLKNEFSDKIQLETQSLDCLQKTKKAYQTTAHTNLVEAFKELANEINLDEWLPEKLDLGSEKQLTEKLEAALKNQNAYFSHENDLFSNEFKWFQFYNKLNKKEKATIDALFEKENWKQVFLIYYLNAALINSADTNLPTDNSDYKALEQSLAALETEQLDYIRSYWLSKQMAATKFFEQKNENLSVANLYNKRKSQRYKRLSLRQIVKFDSSLFTTFFPIILTTPDVCSNLFKGKNRYFDIVLFDEASQLKLEDNLPALLKGKQIVVAGDEHQMPPSNYFSKIFDGSIEDEEELEDEEAIKINRDDLLLSCESLLDFATELGFEKKYLDFHYRSQHPFLIDFSNHAFYQKRLKPLPNKEAYTPIKYIAVNGIYAEHINEAEAEKVLSILEHDIQPLANGNYPSVGIATLNIAQRDLIKNKISERSTLDNFSDFSEKIAELEKNGLFVKNLENIQGDERDVIILSTTYGINEEGKFSQRFGPINHKKGYKLLNVIVTRAKHEIFVCCSIPEKVFLDYKNHLITEGSNNRKGVFYAYLAYAKAVSEQNNEMRLAILQTLLENGDKQDTTTFFHNKLESPFEEEVYQTLLAHFDAKNIIPQFQFAGFRIDLVYDTQQDGLPKIAIECDGANYHASQEAYLYDRHRQKILEQHGFVFHRIWSTNWWRNSKRESEKLVSFIKNMTT